MLTRIPTFITFSKLLQITDCSTVKKSLKILLELVLSPVLFKFSSESQWNFMMDILIFFFYSLFPRWESSSFLVDFSNFIHEWYLKWMPMMCNSCSTLQRSLLLDSSWLNPSYSGLKSIDNGAILEFEGIL